MKNIPNKNIYTGSFEAISPSFNVPQMGPYSLLLIEDNKSDVLLTKKALGGGFILKDVPRLSEALELLSATKFDLILLDLSLIDASGIATVAAIHGKTPHIPIIVHTGKNDLETRQAALLCGAKRYYVKGQEPPHHLRNKVKQLLSTSHAHA